jgi:spore coat protein U-like protein
MRKIILAGAAMLATTGMAMAAGSESFTVSALVTAKCTVTDPANINFNNDSAVNDNQTGTFSFSCNFAGTNGTGAGALKIGFKSTSGGLVNDADSSGPKSYGFKYGASDEVTAATLAAGTGVDYPETSSAAGVPNNRSFVVRLAQALPVAGTYTDTINVTVSP